MTPKQPGHRGHTQQLDCPWEGEWGTYPNDPYCALTSK